LLESAELLDTAILWSRQSQEQPNILDFQFECFCEACETKMYREQQTIFKFNIHCY